MESAARIFLVKWIQDAVGGFFYIKKNPSFSFLNNMSFFVIFQMVYLNLGEKRAQEYFSGWSFVKFHDKGSWSRVYYGDNTD